MSSQNHNWLFALLTTAMACLVFTIPAAAQPGNPKYNKHLADSLGGDQYGMKMYYLVILKTGQIIEDKTITDSLFRGHMQNINDLAASGHLVVAGPLEKNDKKYRGIFILSAKSKEEAQSFVDRDPAVSAKIFDTEIYGWYGSAALPMYLPYHSVIEQKKP